MHVQDASPVVTGCTFSGNIRGLSMAGSSTATYVSGNTFGPQGDNSWVVSVTANCMGDVARHNTFQLRSDGKYGRLAVEGSALTTSATWPVPPSGFVYYMGSGQQLSIGGSNSPVLTLQPGTVMKFRYSGRMYVGHDVPGGLIADGVIFTSYLDDAAGGDTDGTTSSPGWNQWEWILLDTNAVPDSCIFTDCEFRYGGRDGYNMVEVRGVPAVFTGCVFKNSYQAGLCLNGSGEGLPIIKQCAFRFNRYGLKSVSDGRAFGTVMSSCFEGNTLYGLYADSFTDGQGKFAALNCWWGNANGPSGAGPGTGDAITSNINCSPWALEPVCSPLTDVNDTDKTPLRFILYPPYPNPFNPTTTIRFDLPRVMRVRLSVYNVEGKLIATLVDRHMAAGYKEVSWAAKDNSGQSVGSGIYFYRLVAGDFVQTKKMVLLR